MNYQEIAESWSIDGCLDKTKLDLISLQIPQLHNKYYKILSGERYSFLKLQNNLKRLKLKKYEYFQGILSEEELKNFGWEQWDKKLLKTEIPSYIDADDDIIQLKMKIVMAEEKVEFLVSILKEISSIQWNIKNAITFMKFQAGEF